MAKTKPIGVRFPQDMITHFNEVHKVEGHQMMVNYLWTFYAQKAGLLKGSVKITDITKPEQKSDYTIDTMPLGWGHPIADKIEMEDWKNGRKAKIKELETEFNQIIGTSTIAIQRRRFIQNKISELRKPK